MTYEGPLARIHDTHPASHPSAAHRAGIKPAPTPDSPTAADLKPARTTGSSPSLQRRVRGASEDNLSRRQPQCLALRPDSQGALQRLCRSSSTFSQHPLSCPSLTMVTRAANSSGVEGDLRGAPGPDS